MNVTIYNTGALLGSVFHALGAYPALRGGISEALPGRRKSKLVLAYSAIILAVTVLALAPAYVDCLTHDHPESAYAPVVADSSPKQCREKGCAIPA